jgi:hypothetical protein
VPLFIARYRLYPPGPFGLPDEERIVVPSDPSGRSVSAPTIHAGTGTRVGHGSLSEYRKAEEAIRADFSDGDVRISLEDNFLAVSVEASDARAAYDAARAFAELFAQALSVQFGMRFGAEFLLLEDDKGITQPVPRSYQVPFGAMWYNLAEARDRLGIAFDWAIAVDDRSRKAMLYFEHACLLTDFAWTLPLTGPHATFSYALAFLQLFKALVAIVGEPGVDRDYQRKATDLGLPADFWSSRVKPLYLIRNDEDVAHYSLETPEPGAFLDRFRDAAAVFKEALSAYFRWRNQNAS